MGSKSAAWRSGSMISRKKIDESVLRIHPEKALDHTSAREMREVILEAQSEGYRHIILSLSGLDFISSAGVGSIIAAVQSLREVGGDVVLCNASDKILHILNILGLCSFLTIVETEEAAGALSEVRS